MLMNTNNNTTPNDTVFDNSEKIISSNNSNLNSNLDSNLDFNLDSESDSDEYINLNEKIESETFVICQFIINEQNLELKHIGKFNKIADMVIKENFGPNYNMSLYSCLYKQDELIIDSKGTFFPLIKLVIKNNLNIVTSCIAVKLINHIEINKNIENWELYWLETDHDDVKIRTIDKNINPSNIVEKLIVYSLHG